MTWWSVAQAHLAQGQPLALITLCSVRGSAPREAGARMLVWADGQEGTVGGGQLEFTLTEQARRLLAAGAAWRFQNYPLGPLLGQCCGGNVGVLLERLDQSSRDWLDTVAAMEAIGSSYDLISRLDADCVCHQIAAAGDDADTVSMRYPEAIATHHLAEGAIIVQHVTPRPHLLLFGAGHVGQALAPIAATLPFQLSRFDTRPQFAQDGVTVTADPAAAVHAAPPGSYFLVFTHSHAQDYDLTRAVLARGDFAYCGLIGSATKRARFEKRLLADGIASATLTRLTCPIGAIGLASKLPQAMAVAVAAELLLVLEAQTNNGGVPLGIVHAT